MTLKKKTNEIACAAAIQIFLWLFQVRPLPDLWFRSSWAEDTATFSPGWKWRGGNGLRFLRISSREGRRKKRDETQGGGTADKNRGWGWGAARGGEGVGAWRRVEAQASTSQPHGPASHKRFPDEESFVRLCAPHLRASPGSQGSSFKA